MKRSEFLKSLRKELSFLEKKELEEEMLYYINKIDNSKLADKEVIASFGKMEDIVKKVSKKHGVNYETIKEDKSLFKSFYRDLLDLSTILRESDNKKKGKILSDIFLLIVVTCLLKIPFIFVRDLGDETINGLLNNNAVFLVIWGLFIELFYALIALGFFIKTFKKWFKNLR